MQFITLGACYMCVPHSNAQMGSVLITLGVYKLHSAANAMETTAVYCMHVASGVACALTCR